MKLHIYSEGIEVDNKLISLQEAFYFLENQSTKVQVEDNFVGFTLVKDEFATIQFIRNTLDEWLIDVPTYKNSKCVGSLSSIINNQLVFSFTSDFFNPDSTFQNSIKNKNYESVIDYAKKRYGTVFEFEASQLL